MVTSYGYAYDGPPTKCHTGPRSGTVALRNGVMERFPGVKDLGIFNCRYTRTKNSKTYSFHADGRAWDAGCSGDLADEVADFLVAHADVLGVQEVIRNRKRWDSRTRKWATYQGSDPHTDHVHVSQCIAAADGLKKSTVLAPAGTPQPDLYQEEDPMFIITPANEIVLLHAGKLVYIGKPGSLDPEINQWDLRNDADTCARVIATFGPIAR